MKINKVQKKLAKKQTKTKEIISCRKTCNVQGTGLTHYILTDQKNTQ